MLRVLAGFSMADLYLVIESWMNTAGEGTSRDREPAVSMRVPVGLYTVRAPKLGSTPSPSLRALGRVAPLGLGTTLGAGAIGGAVYGMGPAFAKETVVPVGGVSTFITLVVLGGLALPLPVGRGSDRLGPTLDPLALAPEDVPAEETHGFR